MQKLEDRKKVSFSQYKQLLGTYLGTQKGPVILLGVLILFTLGLQVLIPQIMSDFIDSVTHGAGIADLVRLGVIF